MRILSNSEFNIMLNSILYWIWFSEKNKIELDSIGVDHRIWPEKFKAKSLAIKFFELVEKENYLHAQQSLSKDILSLNREEMPKDLKLFKTIYHRNLLAKRAIELAENIVSNPLDCEKLVHKFNTETPIFTKTKQLKDITLELLKTKGLIK